MADVDISDKSGEIVLKTQDASVTDENVLPSHLYGGGLRFEL